MSNEDFKELVLRKEKEGKVVLLTWDGPMEADLEEIIKQPTEGLLYDLNRDRLAVLSFINDPKWVNDYAVGLVIKKLKEYYDKRAVSKAVEGNDLNRHTGELGQ